MNPVLVTFTGADQWTDQNAMLALSQEYPVEWGILFSRKRQGVDPRYPSLDHVERFMRTGLRFAAHICGAYSREIMGERTFDPPVDLRKFARVQVNHGSPVGKRIKDALGHWSPVQGIAQARGVEFPEDESVQWLYDTSGGKGSVPGQWPVYPGRFAGYAGGINPGNVLSVIEAIGATGPYWIDMESGVRTGERFDVGLCRTVCEKVFGRATAHRGNGA